ncbi:hypothetical protein, partial [Sporomusa sphaeroides]
AHLAFYDALLTLFSFQGTTRMNALLSRTHLAHFIRDIIAVTATTLLCYHAYATVSTYLFWYLLPPL